MNKVSSGMTLVQRIALLVTITLIASLVAVSAALAGGPASASKDLFAQGAIHTSGDNGSADCYASGNDDNFSEYCVASFQFGKSDFGLADMDDIVSVDAMTYTLTHNDRAFSDGDMVEVMLTTDVFASDYSALTYDAGLVNGFDASQYAEAPVSLGVFPYTPEAGGETDEFALNLSARSSAAVLAKLNAGEEFSLIILATDSTHDVTYSGLGNTFDPGDPNLTINITASSNTAVGLGSMGTQSSNALLLVVLAFGLMLATTGVARRNR